MATAVVLNVDRLYGSAMARRPRLRNLLLRLALAYLLVAQLLVGGAATARHAATTLAGAAHILCTGGPTDAPREDRGHSLPCCTLGCAAAQPALGADPPGAAAPRPRRLARLPMPAGAPGATAAGRGPFEARGPPARA